MDFWNSLGGMVQVELTSADPEGAIRELSAQGVELYQISGTSEMTVRFLIKRKDLRILRTQCEKQGNTLTLSRRTGLFWTVQGLLGRPVLLLGCLMFMVLVLYLPTRILFVQVEGNSAIPENQLLEAAASAGIRFGASRKEVRSEKMKNALLDAVPQLRWAGVNTYGCTAVISVRERSELPADREAAGIADIVAAVDGVVYSCTASRGTLLCREGDTVRQGQLLISGYTDCGSHIRAEYAQGEVYALTNRHITAVTPAEYIQISRSSRAGSCYSLLIGKKRIKLWKDSGNWGGSCGRMYKEYYITLPGGFRLPIGIAIDTELAYETETVRLPDTAAERLLSETGCQYVTGAMVAGSIRRSSVQVLSEDTIFRLTGSYVCTEMIGRVKREQIGDSYGKSD